MKIILKSVVISQKDLKNGKKKLIHFIENAYRLNQFFCKFVFFVGKGIPWKLKEKLRTLVHDFRFATRHYLQKKTNKLRLTKSSRPMEKQVF